MYNLLLHVALYIQSNLLLWLNVSLSPRILHRVTQAISILCTLEDFNDCPIVPLQRTLGDNDPFSAAVATSPMWSAFNSLNTNYMYTSHTMSKPVY